MPVCSKCLFVLAIEQPVGTEAVWFIDRIRILAVAVAAVGAAVARAAGGSARALHCAASRACARVRGPLRPGPRSSCPIRAQ